jgi:hypothetical protein
LDKGLVFAGQRSWIGGWFSHCGSNAENWFLAQDYESEAVTPENYPLKVANGQGILQ